MEEDDEDIIYAPAESFESGQSSYANNGTTNATIKRDGRNDEEDGEEEGEEVEEEESDSVGAASTSLPTKLLSASPQDIDIITERKGSEVKPEPAYDRFLSSADTLTDSIHPRQSRRIASLKEPQIGTPSTESVPTSQRSPAVKQEPSGKETPTRLGSSYPAVKTSNIDVDSKPIYEPNGKPITDIDMDSGTC